MLRKQMGGEMPSPFCSKAVTEWASVRAECWHTACRGHDPAVDAKFPLPPKRRKPFSNCKLPGAFAIAAWSHWRMRMEVADDLSMGLALGRIRNFSPACVTRCFNLSIMWASAVGSMHRSNKAAAACMHLGINSLILSDNRTRIGIYIVDIAALLVLYLICWSKKGEYYCVGFWIRSDIYVCLHMLTLLCLISVSSMPVDICMLHIAWWNFSD